MRDVNVLRRTLLADGDWDRAAQSYAREHDRYHRIIHTSEEWLTEFFCGISDQARARRVKAMPFIIADPSRIPDPSSAVPNCRIDDSVRARFFGEIQ